MTQESFNNYLLIVQCNLASLADTYAKYRFIGDCRSKELEIKIEIIDAMLSIMHCYTLELDGVEDSVNCLTPDEMKDMADFINNILGINYCINFKLD